MKLLAYNLVLTVDTEAVSEPPPATAKERLSFVQDALDEVNNTLRLNGITVARVDGSTLVQTGDIEVRL